MDDRAGIRCCRHATRCREKSHENRAERSPIPSFKSPERTNEQNSKKKNVTAHPYAGQVRVDRTNIGAMFQNSLPKEREPTVRAKLGE